MTITDEQHRQLAELACIYAWARLGLWVEIHEELHPSPTMTDLYFSLRDKLTAEEPFEIETWDKAYSSENLSVIERWHREQTERILNQPNQTRWLGTAADYVQSAANICRNLHTTTKHDLADVTTELDKRHVQLRKIILETNPNT